MSNFPRKVFFQGLGGAGQRHLRIFRKLLPNAEFFAYRRTQSTPLLNADFTVDTENKIEEKYCVQILPRMEDAWQNRPELTVISLPSSMQASASVEAANRGVDIFCEKPGILGPSDYKEIELAIMELQVIQPQW